MDDPFELWGLILTTLESPILMHKALIGFFVVDFSQTVTKFWKMGKALNIFICGQIVETPF